jgi:FtsH-binding integral membrane protein
MFWDEKRDFTRHPPSSSSSYFAQLSERSRRHLLQVYFRLAITILFCSLSSFLSIRGYLPEAGVLPVLIGSGSLFALQAVNPSQQLLRSGLLYGFGFLEGWGLAPFASAILEIDPSLLYQSLLMTLLVFVSFSATALYSQRRTFISYAGPLVSALLILSVAGLINLFYPTQFVFNLLVYVGLVLFAFMVSFHTQLIVERAESEQGHTLDSIGDAVMLFNNIIALFVRIAIAMMDQEQRRKRRDDKDRNKRH